MCSSDLNAGNAALDASAAPALRRLEDFIRLEYLPAARESLAASSLPGGPGYYAFLVRNATGTELTPAEVHAIGLKEVARIRGAMEALSIAALAISTEVPREQ